MSSTTSSIQSSSSSHVSSVFPSLDRKLISPQSKSLPSEGSGTLTLKAKFELKCKNLRRSAKDFDGEHATYGVSMKGKRDQMGEADIMDYFVGNAGGARIAGNSCKSQ